MDEKELSWFCGFLANYKFAQTVVIEIGYPGLCVFVKELQNEIQIHTQIFVLPWSLPCLGWDMLPSIWSPKTSTYFFPDVLLGKGPIMSSDILSISAPIM